MLVRLPARLERFARVLADRLEHREALAVGAYEALVDEGADRLDVGAAHGLDRLECAAPGEDGHPEKERLLCLSEQVEAPADRVAQGAMPVGGVAGAGGEQLQWVLEPGEDPGRGEHFHSCRRQLDCERQAVEVVADLRTRGEVYLVGLEIGAYRACPFEEHTHCSVGAEWIERKLLLAADPQPSAAGDDGLQARACRRDRAERRRGLDHLLEVVDHEEQLPAPEVGDQPLLEVALEVEEPERPRDRAHDQARVGHGLERHRYHAVGELVGGCRGEGHR